jgi:hypothetical protein
VTFPQTNTTINYLRCIFNTHHTIFYTYYFSYSAPLHLHWLQA